MKHGVVDFLFEKHSKSGLMTALKILKRFKDCESDKEYLSIPFYTWVKLEQLEEYLEHLVNKKPLHKDTLKQIKKFRLK